MNFKLSVNSARGYIRKRDFLAYLISLFPDKKRADTWALCWAYVRWADNVVDSKLDVRKKINFIKKQMQLIKNFKKIEHNKLKTQEKWLAFYLKNDYYNKFNSSKDVIKIFESFVYDLKRKNRILTNKEYLDLVVKKSLFVHKLPYKILFPHSLYPNNKLPLNFGILHQILNDTADLKYDFQLDEINITKNELKKMNFKGNLPYVNKQIMSDIISLRIKLIRKLIDSIEKISNKENIFVGVTSKQALIYVCNKYKKQNGVVIKTPGPYKFLDKLLPRNESIAYWIGMILFNLLLTLPLYGNPWKKYL